MRYSNNDWARDLLVAAYAAIDGDSNDAEHDALIGLVEFAEATLRAQGIELPQRPEWDDE